MKKTLIAGAASAVLAAMPVLGVFATSQTQSITDTLTVNLPTACTFVRYGVAGAASQTGVTVDPTWTDGGDPATAGPSSDATANTSTYIYAATLTAGNSVELGTSHFKAYCNAPDGFDVTVATPNLSDGTNSINYSASTPAANTAGWTLALGDASLYDSTAASAKFMTAATATISTSPVTETATYTVYTADNTPSGTYTGNVVYTFTYDDPNA